MIKLNGVEIKLDKYPDGTFLFKDIPPIGGWCRDNIEWFFESMEELTAVEYITRYCWDHRVVPNLYMPYIPDARMDRVKHENELFTLKYFAQTINSLHFGKVEILDPHSDVSAASSSPVGGVRMPTARPKPAADVRLPPLRSAHRFAAPYSSTG